MSAKHNLHGDVTVDGGSGVARIDLKTTASFGRPFYLYTNGVDGIINAQDSLKLRSDDGDAEIYLNPSGQDYISFTTNSTEQMRIVQSGNVLIGTTTDAGYKLDVNGTFRSKDSSGSGIYWGVDGNEKWFRINAEGGSTSPMLRLGRGSNYAQLKSSYGGTSVSLTHTAGAVNFSTGSVTANSFNLRASSHSTVMFSTAGNNAEGDLYVSTRYGSALTEHFRIDRYGSIRILGATTVASRNYKFSLEGSTNAYTGLATASRITTGLTATANSDVLVGLDINPTFTNGAFIEVDNIALRSQSGKIIHQGLTNATHSDQVYYDSTTGELTYGAASGGSTPTLDEVTTAGSSTTNNISVGTMTSSKTEVDFTPTSDTIALDIRGTGTPNDYFTVSNATGGANDVFLPIFFYKAATYGYNGGVNRYPSGVYGGGFIAAVDDTSYPSAIGAGAAMHFNSRTYANNGPLSNRYLFSWGSWLTTHMAMTASGNLLIGKTSDNGEKLQVNGNADVSGDINADGDFYQNGVQGWSGTINIPTTPPVTITVQGGIITNVT